jgi:cytochrome P450
MASYTPPASRADLPPGPPLPAVAQTFAYMANPIRFIEACHERYGDVFTLDTLLFGVEVAVVQPEVIKQVFTGDPDVLRAGEANAALGPLLGPRSVLLLDGAEHLRQRRLLMPPFHGERMVGYATIMRAVTEAAVASFPHGRPFALHAHMQGITLDIILRTVFGIDDAHEEEHFAALRAALPRLLDRLSNPVASLALAPSFQRSFFGVSPWDGFQRDLKHADALILAQIARRRAASEGRAGRTDILAMLLDARDEQGEPMTDAELRDELMTLLVAGHETTATMLCWAFDLILGDARVRDRIVSELADGADPAQMDYLDATLKEVLRLRPVIPAVGRKLSKPMVVAGYALPVGTMVVPTAYLTQRLASVYPDPTAFRPERFLDKKPDPYAWLPFGGGIRRCLGLAFAMFELKVVLGTVLAKVRLRKARPAPSRVLLRGFTFVPSDGVLVVAEPLAAPRRPRRSPPVEASVPA